MCRGAINTRSAVHGGREARHTACRGGGGGGAWGGVMTLLWVMWVMIHSYAV